MWNKKKIGLTVTLASIVFITAYFGHFIKEIFYPYQGLGSAYKYMTLFFLKLIYGVIFLLGGITMIKSNSSKSWYFLMFASVGILTSLMSQYYTQYHLFRSSIVDLFLLELLCLFILLVFNIKYFTKKTDIQIPKYKYLSLFFIFIVNIGLNVIAWQMRELIYLQDIQVF